MLVRASLATLVTIAACSSSSSSSSPDAATAGPTVMEVTCPATVPLTVDAPDSGLMFVFAPASMPIPAGSIVKFTMHTEHNVVPNATMSDPGITVDLNTTKCLQFTHAGTFGFHCGFHQFVGTITVQ